MHYGTAAPKVVKVIGGDEVLLDAAVILEDRPIYDTVKQPAVEGGHINWKNKGYWWRYVVRIHVYKYNESIAKEKELLGLLGTDVYLYRHSESNPFKDSSGNSVEFRCIEVTPNYFKTASYHDRIDIVFESNEYVDLTQTILPENVLIHRDGTIVTDRDGKYKTDR